MSDAAGAIDGPADPVAAPSMATGVTRGDSPAWQGPTYYGRPALKEAPFNTWVVGGYVFLAGLAGSSAILAAIADAARPDEAEATVRRGRYLSLLAPTIGAGLLIYDLHTPQRFYNMFRVAKRTSPMSIGTWILSTFSVFAGLTAGLQFLADRVPRWRWTRGAARATSIPAAVSGAGMSTYTAALLAATSTPLWAAAPAALAARFGAASISSGAAALSLSEPAGPTRDALQKVAAAAMGCECLVGAVQSRAYRRTGVDEALQGGWGVVEKLGGTGLGVVVPLGLHFLSRQSDDSGHLTRLASVAALIGSLLLRVSFMQAGNVSARRPEISFRFAQPDNLPRSRAARRRTVRGQR
ncbi:MAG: NrfD/PsrC family molybdoenzyme membrane anchor subunit [Acetobacteraceae bacterium]|nr:NrfD/PsrC family molybdoenzyme membrane anchor subunit [Acetobacteraceae bacterium]